MLENGQNGSGAASLPVYADVGGGCAAVKATRLGGAYAGSGHSGPRPRHISGEKGGKRAAPASAVHRPPASCKARAQRGVPFATGRRWCSRVSVPVAHTDTGTQSLANVVSGGPPGMLCRHVASHSLQSKARAVSGALHS